MGVPYQSTYTGKQVDQGAKYAVNPDYFLVKSNSDLGMPQTIAVSDTYQDVVIVNVDNELSGNFTYDGIKLTYTGTEDIQVAVNGACSVDSSIINTIVHIALEKNGVVDAGTESSAKLESNTAIQSVNVASAINLSTGDELNLVVKADKLADITLYHLQFVIRVNKITV